MTRARIIYFADFPITLISVNSFKQGEGGGDVIQIEISRSCNDLDDRGTMIRSARG